MSNNNIIHITTHLGGGVGTVLLSFLKEVKNDKIFKHSVLCLDYANDNAKNKSIEYGFFLKDNLYKDTETLLQYIKDADVVLVHFWNHPLLYNFIITNKLPKCRLIFWAHTSGLYPPNVFTNKILNYPDKFIFTTPMSYDNVEVLNFNNKNKLDVIWSTSKIDKYIDLQKEEDKYFNILYVGTVDSAKIYSNFVKLCSKINIPNIRFIVCGGHEHLKFEQEANRLGISFKFKFLGKVDDITEYLKISKIFGYPLSNFHFGTCDQSLQEAMIAGLVPIVMNNPMEKYMVSEDCGFICNNEEEYIMAIEKLYHNPELLYNLSTKVKKYALDKFSISNMIEKWNHIFSNIILNVEKTEKYYKIDKNISSIKAIDLFFESIGTYQKIFQYPKTELQKELSKPNWTSLSKGTHLQYRSFFNDGSLDKFII